MFNQAIAKYIGYPLQDIVKGTQIIKTLTFLRQSQYWSEERINQYQLRKLKAIIDYSKKNVPYYEKLFNRLKLSSADIKSLDDIYKIPVLTKEIVREQGNNLVSKNFKKYRVKKGKTGGTTGAPVILYKDANNRTFTWASYYRWYEWMGIRYFDRVATFWGAATVLTTSVKNNIKLDLQQLIQNEMVLNSFKMDVDTMADYAKKLQHFEPVLLKGYLSAIIQFGKFVEENNYEFNSLKAISTTTETLLPHNRKYLEDVFGVPVYDQYGSGEVSAISYECSAHNGLHINQEHVICEVLNDNDQPVFNISGRVIATDLDNFVMPFIRYENGDRATLSDEKCRCGVNQPLMKSIEGRSIDTVTLGNGRNVHGVFFTDILYELNILSHQIQRFQIYQNIPGEIEFRVENSSTLSDDMKIKIEKAFLKFLDKVKIIEMKELPLTKSGKFSYIINDIKN